MYERHEHNVMASPTLPLEYFFRAGQFRRAYEKPPPDREPPDWPKYLLFYRAIELALKSYLIACRISADDLKDEFRHDLKKLVNEAVDRGLSLPQGSKEMIAEVGGRPPQQIRPPGHLTYGYAIRSTTQCSPSGSSTLTLSMCSRQWPAHSACNKRQGSRSLVHLWSRRAARTSTSSKPLK